MAGLAHNLHLYLGLSAVLFSLGVMAVLSRRNAIGVFMGVELMLNAAALNFIVFQAFKKPVEGTPAWLDGHIFALFIIILAAIEAAVALAIVLRVFAYKNNVDPDGAAELKG